MDVVYLFCKSGYVRIPFFDDDRRLFDILLRSGGSWVNARREFIFRYDTKNRRLMELLENTPCVWVDENANAISGVSYFFGEAREENTGLSGAGENGENRFSEDWETKLEAELRSRKYSLRTIRSYVYYNRLFCRVLRKTPEEIHPEDLTAFLAFVEKDRNYSASSLNLAISGIKFFYRHIMRTAKMNNQHRPAHDKNLPMVLDKSEVAKILTLEKNQKHRLLLMLAYSSGLRVSEVVALKKEHIDPERKIVYVKRGKGRKDRCTPLAEKAARYLEEYIEQNEITTWLFPGQRANAPLSIRAAQHIFEKALRRAEIDKKLSIHSLRHTFATHLLESGTDIRYIQALLGHISVRTTERYTHIARRNILNIKSPLDTI